MLWLILGGLVLVIFLGGLRAFERASVATVKSLFAWIVALGDSAWLRCCFSAGAGLWRSAGW